MLRTACLLSLVAACGHPVAPTPDAAPQSVVLGSLSDTCAGMATLTGQQALAMLMPAYSPTYTPIAGGASSTVSFAVTYDTGQIVCNTPYGGEADMGPSIDLAVHASFATSDGQFQEHFDATLTLESWSNGPLRFEGTVAIADLHGSYSPQIGGTWSTHDVSFGGEIFAAGTTTGTVEEQASSGNMGRVIGAGMWQ